MLILGYNCHVFDSAACIFRNGKIVAAVQEERLSRQKGTGAFPKQSISYCLKAARAEIDDLDHVAYYWDPFHGFYKRLNQIAWSLPQSLNFWNSHADKWLAMTMAQREITKNFPGTSKQTRFQFHNVRHHVAHAASAFYPSPYDEAAILIMDGSGEIESTTLAMGEDKRIEILESANFPNSLGYVYVALTDYLGFKPDSDEYKVMGLSSLGRNSEAYDKFKQIIQLRPKGLYQVDLNYFNFHKGIRNPWVSKKFIGVFGPQRKTQESISPLHMNIAWALQKRFEDVVKHSTDYLYQRTGKKKLVLGGGCALNCVVNGKLVASSPFKNIWVNPAPNDSGTGLGAALWIQGQLTGRRPEYRLENAYLGPEYSLRKIKADLQKFRLPIRQIETRTLVREIALRLSRGEIVGWYQGRSEFGPRALGNRSILADPRRADIKDKINRLIKHRENFRPFAPAVLAESAHHYFENSRSMPFMTFVLKVKKAKEKVIPAVVHSDSTARVQTVDKNSNPRFYNLIQEFQKVTGVPVLLNTSFNDQGEPIVDSPVDAIRSFAATNLDVLVMGNYLVYKEDLSCAAFLE